MSSSTLSPLAEALQVVRSLREYLLWQASQGWDGIPLSTEAGASFQEIPRRLEAPKASSRRAAQEPRARPIYAQRQETQRQDAHHQDAHPFAIESPARPAPPPRQDAHPSISHAPAAHPPADRSSIPVSFAQAMQDISFSPSSRPVEAAPFDQATSEASWAGRFFSSPASLLTASNLSAYPRLWLASPCQGIPEIEEREARAALDALEAELPSCVRCQGGRCRYHIKGEGPARTRLLCIFEGPNSGEDLRGKPFQGEAGKLLDGIFRSMGLRRDQIHLAPIIACRPRQGEEGGWSMNPSDAEIRRYLPSLYKRIQIVQPDIILALGVLPAKHLLNKQEHFRDLHGQWFRRAFDQRDLLIFPTYHPTFLLRNPKEKPKAWQDICAFLRQPLSLEMPS